MPVTMDSKDIHPSINEITKYNCEQLVNFLEQCVDIKLNKDSNDFLKQQYIDGKAFLQIVNDNALLECYFKVGPALKIKGYFVSIAKEKKRAFRTYELEDLANFVLENYGIVCDKTNVLKELPVFKPGTLF